MIQDMSGSGTMAEPEESLEGCNIQSGSAKVVAAEREPCEISKALSLLSRVRELLAHELERGPLPETFACPLSVDIPLRSAPRLGFHGFCDIKVDGYEDDVNGIRRAVNFTVRSVSLQLCDKAKRVLPVEMLLATFVHELAHTVTCPEMQQEARVSSSILKLQPHAKHSTDGFLPVHHSETFYANFAELLRVAERLGIYVLPVAPNKFAAKSLQRFDAISLEASLGGLNLGRSHLFATALGAEAKPFKVIVTDAKRVKQKPITLEKRTVADVLGQAKQRLNLRKRPTSIVDSSGSTVDDARLAELDDGVLLVVS